MPLLWSKPSWISILRLPPWSGCKFNLTSGATFSRATSRGAVPPCKQIPLLVSFIMYLHNSKSAVDLLEGDAKMEPCKPAWESESAGHSMLYDHQTLSPRLVAACIPQAAPLTVLDVSCVMTIKNECRSCIQFCKFCIPWVAPVQYWTFHDQTWTCDVQCGLHSIGYSRHCTGLRVLQLSHMNAVVTSRSCTG